MLRHDQHKLGAGSQLARAIEGRDAGHVAAAEHARQGLLGRARITTGTAVAKVNGDEIPYTTWVQAAQQRIQQEQQGRGRSLTLDEEEQIRNDVFNQLVQSILLDQEYKRRGIRVTDEEIVQAAQYSPPPQFMQSPELQTDGQFDPAKYQRLLASSQARQGGLLVALTPR